MNKLWKWLALCGLAISCQPMPAQVLLPATPYTTLFMTNQNGSQARAYLGIGSGSGDVVFDDFNQAWFDTNSPVSLTNHTFTNISLWSGITVEDAGSLTNLYDLLSISALAEGDLLWFDGADLTILSAGSDNQVLTLNGAALNWETPAAAGVALSDFSTDQFGTNVSGEIIITNGAVATNLISRGYLRVAEGVLSIRGETDTDTGIYWAGSDQIQINANGNNKVQVTDSQVTMTAPLVVSSQTVTASGYTLSAATGNRPAYINGSGTLAEAALFAPAGNTGDVDVTRMNILSSASASGTTFRTLSGTNGTMVVTNHSAGTNIVIGITNLASVATGVGMSLAQGDILWYDGANITNLAVGTDDYVLKVNGSDINWEADPRTGVYRTLWVDAGAMISRTTSGAATGTEEYATNDLMSDSMAYDDSTDEFAQVRVVFDNWGAGTVKVKFYWTSAASSGDVIWTAAGVASANDDAIDTAFGTAQSATDTATAAGDLQISSATAAITIAGSPTAEEAVWFQFSRDADNGSDTLSGDAKLLGVLIQYQEAATEASAW